MSQSHPLRSERQIGQMQLEPIMFTIVSQKTAHRSKRIFARDAKASDKDVMKDC